VSAQWKEAEERGGGWGSPLGRPCGGGTSERVVPPSVERYVHG
jgi:hypothetical protein